MLEEEGWLVKTYPNADSFLTLDDPEVPGCLILDYLMPKVNGVELQKQLKDKGFSQPVIFLTAHADLDMAISVFTKGAFHLLKKPVDPLTLLQTIEEATAKDKMLEARTVIPTSIIDGAYCLKEKDKLSS